MNIFMSVFTRRFEGTYYRAYPWARQLAANGHRVTLACVSPSRRFTSATEVDHGVHILETPNFIDGRATFRKLCGMSGWGPLDAICRLQALRRGRYDRVHVFEHHINVALPVYLAGRRYTPLLVVDGCDHYGKGGFRDEGPRARLHQLYRLPGVPVRAGMDMLERNLRLRANGITTISRYLSERAITMGIPPERVVCIPGCADVDAITPQSGQRAKTESGINLQRPVVAFFGGSLLDLDLLLTAFTLVLRSRPDTLLLMIGRTTPASHRHIRSFELGDRILQTGWIPEERLSTWLACADVFALPMTDTPVNRARWPNKIGAHMAAARPTVCTQVGDVSELVCREGIGLVSSVSPEAFSSAILTLINSPALAATMGIKARTTGEQQFNIRTQVQVLEQAYARFSTSNPVAVPDADTLADMPDLTTHQVN